MRISSVTVGLAVSDLVAARCWYESVLDVDGPQLEPVEGIVEYDLGGCWLQLGEEAPTGSATAVLRLGVDDVHAERARLVELGLAVPEVVHVPGVLDVVDFPDPDGNHLSLYTLVD
jgi:predicted enzyme related to lactoylglutathione lyase